MAADFDDEDDDDMTDSQDSAVMLMLKSMGRQIDTLAHLGRESNSKLEDLRVSVAEIKGQDLKARLDEHDERIEELEETHSRRAGAMGLVDWLGKNFPWIATIIAAVAAYFGFVHK